MYSEIRSFFKKKEKKRKKRGKNDVENSKNEYIFKRNVRLIQSVFC